MITILLLIAAGVWAIPQLPVGTPRMAGWAVLVLATAVSVWALGPRRRGRR